MFTGIITEVGRLAEKRSINDGVELVIEAPQTAPRLAIGASISVNGVCQTVVALAPPRFTVQAVGSTMDRTTLGRLNAGAPLNLESSLKIGDELGGHLVMGHVDGVGRVEGLAPRGDAVYLTVSIPPELTRFVASRGSIAVDGTSLTVAAVEGEQVTISLIPHTFRNTVAARYQSGDQVNIEADLLARYLDRLLAGRDPRSPESITLEILKEKFS